MAPRPIHENTLFYGDNLPILREYIPDESVDLVYLDPPFNSQRSYNVLFKDEGGIESEAQISAFDDTWHWTRHTEETYYELVTETPDHVARMVAALHEFIGANQMMAYLVMMCARLVELHRVLKPTGSLYLHCDPTTSHYLKIILDTIFGAERFVNEIIWKRTTTHSDAKRWAPTNDTILFYSKTGIFTWNPQYTGYNSEYVASKYRHNDNDGRGPYQLDNMTSPNPRPNMMYEWMGFPSPPKGWRYQRETMQKLHDEGRIYYPRRKDGTLDTTKRPRLKRYLDDMPGTLVSNIWTDINPINAQDAERMGYPTQKPLALLERIVEASSNPGDWVLDPFCGCGTAVAAAQKLGRRWIGIDITHLAISLQKYRLKQMFPDASFRVLGEPTSVAAAQHLADQNRFQFEWWALSLVSARPTGGEKGSRRGKKGADRGIDGVINFVDEANGKLKQVLVQVKSGQVSSRDIRDLQGTIDREKAAMGVLITLAPPTSAMQKEAVLAGFYPSPIWRQDYPKIQILTIGQLLDGAGVDMPPEYGTFKRAQQVRESKATQTEMDIGLEDF